MSAYEVNRVCYRTVHDPAFRVSLQKDPQETLADLPLTDQERGALLAGEVGTLFLLGVHPFLLGHLQRYGFFGLNPTLYTRRMKEAAASTGQR